MDPYLKTDQAAAILQLSPKTLEQWRHEGRGPRFYRRSHRCVRYSLADLQAWLEKSAVDNEANGH
jgi:predicted DNA-binding transcriptional regulator AlpA